MFNFDLNFLAIKKVSNKLFSNIPQKKKMAELKLPKAEVEKLEVDRTDTDGLPVLDKYNFFSSRTRQPVRAS